MRIYGPGPAIPSALLCTFWEPEMCTSGERLLQIITGPGRGGGGKCLEYGKELIFLLLLPSGDAGDSNPLESVRIGSNPFESI